MAFALRLTITVAWEEMPNGNASHSASDCYRAFLTPCRRMTDAPASAAPTLAGVNLLGDLIMIYSILSNGQMVEGRFPIGYDYLTQWGFRKVISHCKHVSKPPTEPYGV